jgi:hypothetical protein
MSNEKFTPGPWNVFDNGLIFVQPPPDSGTLVIAGCGTSFIGDGGEQAQWQIDRNRAGDGEMYQLKYRDPPSVGCACNVGMYGCGCLDDRVCRIVLEWDRYWGNTFDE